MICPRCKTGGVTAMEVVCVRCTTEVHELARAANMKPRPEKMSIWSLPTHKKREKSG